MLLTANQSPLVGGTASSAAKATAKRRCVLVTRSFLHQGKATEVGSVIELDARVAFEVFTSNKAVPSEGPPSAPPGKSEAATRARLAGKSETKES